jgi:hypothetical protein
MTEKFLDAAIASGKTEAVLDFFRELSEAQRKTYAQRCQQWLEVNIYDPVPTPGPAGALFGAVPFQDIIRAGVTFNQRSFESIRNRHSEASKLANLLPSAARQKETRPACQAAVLASCSLSEIKKMGITGLPEASVVLAALTDRKPRWMSGFASWICDSHLYQNWNVARELERKHHVELEHDEDYLTTMAVGMPLCNRDLAEVLKDDPEALKLALDRMLRSFQSLRAMNDAVFRGSLGGRRTANFIASAQAGRKLGQLWRDALVSLQSAGAIERRDLLDAVLSSIGPMAQAESEASASVYAEEGPSAWLIGVHDALNLTLEERHSHLSDYLRVLNSRFAPALGWAIDQLGQLLETGKISAVEYCPQLEPAFFVTKKDPALAALKLFKTLSKKNPEFKPVAARLATLGLEHPSQEVQKRAVSVVTDCGDKNDSGFASELLLHAENASALQKQAIADWLKDAATPLEEQPVVETPTASHEQLLTEAAAVDPHYAQLANLPHLIEILNGGTAELRALKLDPFTIPHIYSAAKLQPILEVNDLVMLFLKLLENAGDADDLELCLDGVSRLCNERSPEFRLQTASLKQRATHLLSQEGRNEFQGARPAPFAGQSARCDLSALALAWIDGSFSRPGPLGSAAAFIAKTSPTLLAFFSLRVSNIAERAAKRISLPLLSAPSHKRGWIDPRLILKRLAEWQNAKQPLDIADAIQALLRLAPDFRQEALSALPAPTSEFLQALRYALGDSEDVVPKPPKSVFGAVTKLFGTTMIGAPLWVAACRARAPQDDDPLLNSLYAELGPDSTCAARYQHNIEKVDVAEGSFTFAFNPAMQAPFEAFLQPSPARRGREASLFPTELLHNKPVFSLWGWSEKANWETYAWPLSKESQFAAEARQASAYLDSQSPNWRGDWDALFDPDVPANGMACWLVATALTVKNQECQRLALDGLIAAIDDSRMDGFGLGDVLSVIVTSKRFKSSRLVAPLKEAARVSPLHNEVIKTALQKSLSGLPKPDDAPPVKLLELLFELSHDTHSGIEDADARRYLECIVEKQGTKKSVSKSAKLAKSLLDLPCSPTHRMESAAYALEHCIERARRWQSARADEFATSSA